ncbi:MAG: hypothetical protein AAF512_25460, partial [Pseudomonadota bacterium]
QRMIRAEKVSALSKAQRANKTEIDNLLKEMAAIRQQVFKIGNTTLTNFALHPAPPARVFPNRKVRISYHHKNCCNETVNIAIKPIIEGKDCNYGASDAPTYSSDGRGEGDFRLEGAGCRSAEINALSIEVTNTVTMQTEVHKLKVRYMGR